MKFNGAIFSKPQQDQLKENIGNELEKVSARMLNYKGDWVDGDEYHEKDIVTWTDGNLYEVIKAHTSSNTLKPGNTEYYKAMTIQVTVQNHDIALNQIVNYHPTIVPDAVFIANLDKQNVVLRIENVTSNGHEYTLSSAFQFAKYGTNAVFVYSLIINTETNTKNGYKASISGSDVSITSVTVPSTIKVCYNGKN